MDTIFLHGLQTDCIVGIRDWERRARQVVILDLDLAADIRRAAARDDIAETLDYKAVAKRVVAFVGASEYRLVESLAEAVAELLGREFDVSWRRVRINKRGAIRGAADVGVVIERGTRDGG